MSTRGISFWRNRNVVASWQICPSLSTRPVRDMSASTSSLASVALPRRGARRTGASRASATRPVRAAASAVRPSGDRRPAPCPAFGRCGGCQLQHLSPERYQSWKTDMLEKCLSDAEVSPAKWAAAFWGEEGTRRRATLSYRRTTDTAIIGFLGRQTHFILTIDNCLILHPALKAMLPPEILCQLGLFDLHFDLQFQVLDPYFSF